ncbi:hypothetical protein [uncultured Umboniibacter sp.]|uniref:hypothetical protein n=1 Tax=uncultured Umboniibacter sp. TaxID=1798917 RepID=UPI00261A363E|nr:hypothetical protein [uncultured Umboniibacter sp.]
MENFIFMSSFDVLISLSLVIFFAGFCAFFAYSVKKNEKSTGLPLDDEDYELLNINKPD